MKSLEVIIGQDRLFQLNNISWFFDREHRQAVLQIAFFSFFFFLTISQFLSFRIVISHHFISHHFIDHNFLPYSLVFAFFSNLKIASFINSLVLQKKTTWGYSLHSPYLTSIISQSFLLYNPEYFRFQKTLYSSRSGNIV